MKIDYRARQLAIPPMHQDIPRAYRVQVMEYVLRRQYGLAYDLAMDQEDLRQKGKLRAPLATIPINAPSSPEKNTVNGVFSVTDKLASHFKDAA